MSEQDHMNQKDKDQQAHWIAQRKKARKTAVVLGVLAVGIAVWSVFVVLQKAGV
ncbi:hypothetical protein [Marinicella rhabdoformis]|uniref:hypothetical protein n=1 Tax=Marinicella rhabdoformis TaxID=2580566 RepID=UPI0012AEBB4C|nr:hypothetical protein [Marinicella rhabdoformis]